MMIRCRLVLVMVRRGMHDQREYIIDLNVGFFHQLMSINGQLMVEYTLRKNQKFLGMLIQLYIVFNYKSICKVIDQ